MNNNCMVLGNAVFDGPTGNETVLSNGKLTASHWGDANEGGARSVSYANRGRLYFELAVANWIGIDTSIGLVVSGGTYHDIHAGSAKAVAIYFSDGSIWNNDQEVIALGEVPIGARVDVAADLDAEQVWFRVDDDFWNGDENANPATGIGGVGLQTFEGAPCAITLLFAGPNIAKGGVCTLNAGEQEFSGEVPTGYQGWPR